MFQGCTGNRQNLASLQKPADSSRSESTGPMMSVAGVCLASLSLCAQASTQRNDDLFLPQIASAIPGPLARLIYTIRNFDWTLCAPHNYRHFFQRRTAYWLRFALLSNLAAGAGPVGVACLQLICRDAAAIFTLLELRIAHSGPRPTTQLASHRLAAN
jgi:hypothetical protein